MKCEACSQSNPAANRFCAACGAALAVTCMRCGRISEPGAAYCGSCGTSLAVSASTGHDPSRTAARKVAFAQGELKHVTVLFVDLVSSTELVARLDAEAAMRRLQPLLLTMCEAVERFGGTVLHSLGDGIMALFGAPLTQEGHAVLACQAALAIRDELRLEEVALSVRGGLHSGEVVADAPLPGPLHTSGAYGMTLHLGSRLPAQAEPGDICITETCYRLVRSFCEVRPLGDRMLRGVPDPVALYSLIGMKPAVASAQFRGVALTPFLARDQEIALLRDTLRAVEAAAGRVTGIIGAPGAGKSRLCYEFAELCRGRMIPVFEARAQPYGAATPLRPILELLRSAYFRVTPNDAAGSAVAAIADSLAEIGATTEADLALICDFLGIPFHESPPPWLSANARNARLMEIVRAIVRQRGTTASVVIIEDLHWLDEASEGFVAALAQAVVATRTMLIVNYRPAYARSWMRTPNFQQIELTDFNPSDTAGLVEELIGPDAGLEEIRDRIATRSGGNPFFAEELVRSLVDHGILTGPRGVHRRGDADSVGTLPATVQAVIGARIDRLSAPERDVLHVGSVIGKEFELSVLRSVTGHDDRHVEATLERLCATGLLHRSESPDGRGYGFRHPLVQEVAYASQLKSRRSLLHAAVARAIEEFHPDRRDEFAALLAFHLEEAGELQPAAFYAARAARWIGLTSSAQAMKHWQKVRTLLAGSPRSRATDPLRIEASGKIAWLGWREGLTKAQAQPFIQEALQWARETDDSLVSLLLLVDGRIAQISGGKSDLFVQQVRRAIALAERRGDTGRVATLQASLSHAYGWAGLLREALAANNAALAAVTEVTDFDHQFLGYSVEHWTLSLRGRILLRLGRFDAARACFDRIIGIRVLIDPTVLFVAHFGYVDMAWCLDDAAMAAEHAAQIAALAARHGSAYLRLYQLASSATADGIAGRYDRAIQATTDSLEFLRRTRAAIEFEPELLASLADYLARKGAHAEAIETARDAIAIARRRDARLPECRATITLAGLSLLVGGVMACDGASALLAQAERLIAESGACIYKPRLDEARALLDEFVRRGAVCGQAE